MNYRTIFLLLMVLQVRRISRFIMFATILAAGFSNANAENEKRVFMFVTEGSRDLELMLTAEVAVMRRMLEDAGYTVDIGTSGDQTMTSDSMTLQPTVSLAEIDIDRYVGVILPCMAPASDSPTPAKVTELLKAAVAQEKPIAASRAAVIPLAEAGGVAGREYAFASPVDTSQRPEFSGGKFLGIGVVRDGNISTAGICPLSAISTGEEDGTVELTRSFIESLAEST